jgi:hypothetical protein
MALLLEARRPGTFAAIYAYEPVIATAAALQARGCEAPRTSSRRLHPRTTCTHARTHAHARTLSLTRTHTHTRTGIHRRQARASTPGGDGSAAAARVAVTRCDDGGAGVQAAVWGIHRGGAAAVRGARRARLARWATRVGSADDRCYDCSPLGASGGVYDLCWRTLDCYRNYRHYRHDRHYRHVVRVSKHTTRKGQVLRARTAWIHRRLFFRRGGARVRPRVRGNRVQVLLDAETEGCVPCAPRALHQN